MLAERYQTTAMVHGTAGLGTAHAELLNTLAHPRGVIGASGVVALARELGGQMQKETQYDQLRTEL